MNLVDMLGGLTKPNINNDLSNKIAVKAELKKIERRGDDFVDEILNFISNETDFINRNLSYSYGPNSREISDEDKKTLNNKVKEVIEALPEKLKSSLEGIFTIPSKKEEEPTNEIEVKKIDVSDGQENPKVIVPSQEAIVQSSMFGY